MTPYWMIGIGFLLGSIPFSVWLGRLALHEDIRQYGQDQNPGAANAWKAGKWQLGVPVLFLDFLKGALPIGIFHYGFSLTGWWLIPVAVAPIFGHAFSPFLDFRGGKGLAVTFGIWTGLTLFEGPLVLGGLLAGLIFLLSSNAWASILGMLFFGSFLYMQDYGVVYGLIWVVNFGLLYWKHRHELTKPPRLHPRVEKRLKGFG